MHATSILLFASLALAAPSSAQTSPRPSGPLVRGASGSGGHVTQALNGACTPEWVPTFGPAAGTDGIVYRSISFDDGSGPALVVVGDFTAADGRSAPHVARWDGTQWSPMGQGLAATGYALAVHDDGTGPALYAGGGNTPTSGPATLARWNGVDWDPLAFPGVGVIQSLASYDDSTGRALYVGGSFTLPSGTFARIVRFDGTVWTAMPGVTIPGPVTDLAVHTEGGVTSLYVAFFGTANVGAQQSDGALRWSSTGWSAIPGQAVQGAHRLAVHDDGGGAALYIGGLPVGSTPRALARLVNGNWAEVAVSVPGMLEDLASIDLGAGPRLHVAVEPPASTSGAPVVLELVGGALATVVTEQVDGTLDVRGIAGFDPGTGTQLALFGHFGSTSGTALYNVARVDGNQWRALGGNPDVQRPVELATAFGSGAARRWVAVRQRANTSGDIRPFIDAWDGSSWTTLGETTGVTMLQVLDDGNGERLYAGGHFTTIGGVAANGIAVHDGTAWSALGAGVAGGAPRCAALIDLGQGPLVIVGGDFTSAGGAPVTRIASWDGNVWSPLAGGGVVGTANALAVDDSGATPLLYVGGQFGTAGGVTCNSITRWNGTTWSNLGPGLTSFVFTGTVDDLELFDEGQGPRLFVIGDFEVPGFFAFGGITRWDGANWSVVGGASAGASVNSSGPARQRLLVHDDGTGRALYVAGRVDVASTSWSAHGVARWDGATWDALPGEPFDGVVSLSVFDPGDGRSLMCAGSFHGSPAGDAFVTRWRGCPAVVGDVYCAPAVPNSSGVSATMSALGSTSIAEDDVVLSATDLPLDSFAVFLTSQTQALVPGYNGSQGALCLGGAFGSFTRPGEVQNSGAAGAIELALDLTSLPTPTGAVPVAPGETWHFQAWYRDRAALGATSNFTPGVSVDFE